MTTQRTPYDSIVPYTRTVHNRVQGYRQCQTDYAPLVEAAKAACEHIEELEEAWLRGIIHENDGHGGLRSNRNAACRVQLQNAIAQAWKGD